MSKARRLAAPSASCSSWPPRRASKCQSGSARTGIAVARRARRDCAAAGEHEPGDGHPPAGAASDARFDAVLEFDRRQRRVRLGRQQALVGEGSGRDDAHHAPLHRPLGGRRVADLLADRDRFAQAHEAREILVHADHRHAGHAHRGPAGLSARGQRQVEQARALFRVLVEELVEVAHSVEDEDLRMLGLDAQVLLHDRRVTAQRRLVGGHRRGPGLHGRRHPGPFAGRSVSAGRHRFRP
jgi:hypothetical protein